MLSISVIIPVYNAEKYLRKSVESAINLKQVGEVILVEDKSPDNALALCRRLEKEYQKVKVFQHPNGENKGAGASRNLGVEKTQFEYIAFLDADDWFLPNRFVKDEMLLRNKFIDGVYGATGFYIEGYGLEQKKLTTFKQKISPENLLYKMIIHDGRFTTNAITVKKSLIIKAGMFDTSLRLHQDTHLWYKLAHLGNLQSGLIHDAVAVRRVHEDNRITHKNKTSRNLLHKAVFNDFKNYNNVDKASMRIITNRYIQAISGTNVLRKFLNYSKIFFKHPKLISNYI